MGAVLTCFSATERKDRTQRPLRHGNRGWSSSTVVASGGSSGRWNSSRSGRKDYDVGDLLPQEALMAAAILLRQQNRDASAGALFDRSASTRHSPAGGKKKEVLERSSSSRARSSNDPLIDPQELVDKNIKIDNMEGSNHVILVHGGGFGAWCWYKTVALLLDSGFKVDAIDLTGSGINLWDTNDVKNLGQYVKPLTDFLGKLEEEKVILVGHDFGGTCVSYAMELYPTKITKAIFLCAAMLKNGQKTLDIFSEKSAADDLVRRAQIFLYAKGRDMPPTAIDFNKSFVRELLFNQSSEKDIALATMSMRPTPFAPILETLSLTDGNYGSVPRFYIETTEDNAIPLHLQQSMCDSNPPEKVFRLKGADHAPFFSKPQALHKYLVEIAKMPTIQNTQTGSKWPKQKKPSIYIR